MQFRKFMFSLGAGSLFALGCVAHARAADYQNLAVVKPIMSCDQLASIIVKTDTGLLVTIKSAATRDTPKGPYCHVTGSVAPDNNGISVDLPIEHWTQRYVQGGIQRAGSCTPALNGEFASGGTGGGGGNFETDGTAWGMSPQERINSAYNNQHMASIGAKAVIKAFYGQPVKYSYMIGCSGPGVEVLKIAERFPEDFDGYSIGAPPLYQTVHDLGFWHGWEYHVNQRSDGSIILTKDKLPILHDAAIAHCAAVSGVIDGELQQPTACTFQKSWVQCPSGATDTSKCLTPEEASVAEQLYLGPNDGKNFFEVSGFPLGSELNWRLSIAGKPADGEALTPHGLHSYMMPPLSGETTKEIMAQFQFTQEWWDKGLQMAPLFNAGDTNLRPLAALGHKIILWNGAEDNVVQPATTISYFEAVQKEMGEKLTDTALRLFLLPGVGHCGGGDGANQVDILSPLMAWVETNKAPALIVAGKPVAAAGGPGGGGPGGPGPAGPGGPNAAGGPGGPAAGAGGPNAAGGRAQNAAAGRGGPVGPGGPGGGQAPYATPDRPTIYTRPVYPFPNVAKYKGTGDPNDAVNYEEVKGPMKYPQAFTNETSTLLGPNNLKFYKAENGQLVEISKP